MTPLKAPFPYFGGKRSVAGLVWSRLGNVRNYIEPFCGSAAMLLLRPEPPAIETINDVDCMVANFWRATQQAPDAVIEHCDWPVNEADLHARHRWLVLSDDAASFREKMRTDPHYFDPRIAGYWVWGQCCWIGGGWCKFNDGVNRRPDLAGDGKLNGVHRGPKLQMPDTTGDSVGKGVHKLSQSLPDLSGDGGAAGRGIHGSGKLPLLPAECAQRPNIEQVNGVLAPPPSPLAPDVEPSWHIARQGRPQLADEFSRGRGVHGHDAASVCADRRVWLLDWFGRLRDRLRSVRVCCGKWSRVCGSRSVTTRIGITGVFLDPPYPTHAVDGTTSRDGNLYATDGTRDELDQLRDEVLAWCVEHGDNPQMRIAVCGLDTDGYAVLEPLGWIRIPWKSHGGYGNRNPDNDNNKRERIWFSPHCLVPSTHSQSRSLFAEVTT